MVIIGALLVSTLAGLSTMIGGLIIFFKVNTNYINKFITGALAFSLAIMIGISITDLIPESSYNLLANYGIGRGIIYGVIAFLLGIFLTKYLHQMMEKVDKKGDLYKLGILNMVALICHNFPEGIATFMSSYKDLSIGIKLAIAIALHNIPEGISIAVPIYYATKSKKEALFKTFLSGIAEPIGAILAYIFLAKYITDSLISLILLLVAGIMISLAIEVIYPKAHSYKENFWLTIGIFLGLGLVFIGFIFF